MATEIKRKVELALVALFGESLSGFTFYPAKGGTDIGGTDFPRPPFGSISINSAERTTSVGFTWLLKGNVLWISRAGIPSNASKNQKTDVIDHSDVVQQIYTTLENIGIGYDPERNIIVHGLDILSTDSYMDVERHAYGDTIEFSMGVTENVG